MARLDRALVAVSNTIGKLADNAQERQQEKWRAMRDENFMRLQSMLGEQSRDKDRALNKEDREADRAERRTMFGEETKARKEMFDAETAARRTEAATERDWRGKQNAADRAVTLAQVTDKQGKDYDTRYLGQLDKIDKRIQEINDYKTQGVAEGKFIDNSATAAYDQELAQLMEQRRSLAQERDVTLARNGDNRYRKLSPEEVAAIRKENGGQMPGQPPSGQPEEDGMPMAAQAPRGGSSVKVPQAPVKPPGMVAREERKRTPDRQAAAPLGDLPLGNWEQGAAGAPPPRPSGLPQAGEGGRQLVDLGRKITGAVSDRTNEPTVVKQAMTALQSGKAPAADVVQALAKIDRKRLTGVFGLSESDLAALGL